MNYLLSDAIAAHAFVSLKTPTDPNQRPKQPSNQHTFAFTKSVSIRMFTANHVRKWIFISYSLNWICLNFSCFSLFLFFFFYFGSAPFGSQHFWLNLKSLHLFIDVYSYTCMHVCVCFVGSEAKMQSFQMPTEVQRKRNRKLNENIMTRRFLLLHSSANPKRILIMPEEKCNQLEEHLSSQHFKIWCIYAMCIRISSIFLIQTVSGGFFSLS